MQGLQQQIAAQAVEQNLRAIASKIEEHLDDEMHKLDNMNEEDKNKLEKDFKKAISHLRMILKTYDSNRYSVMILVANKESWIKKIVV